MFVEFSSGHYRDSAELLRGQVSPREGRSEKSNVAVGAKSLIYDGSWQEEYRLIRRML